MIQEVDSNQMWISFTSHKQYTTFLIPYGVKLAFSIV